LLIERGYVVEGHLLQDSFNDTAFTTKDTKAH
jgi:hypothetical protein